MKRIKSPYLIIFLSLLLAYFPVVSFIAGVKNDILTGYLPVRFFMSESLASGYIPWWNPYLNFGIPQYADMSSSFWSPVTWIISLTTGYNVYTITIELLFYILMAGWGMYKCGEIFEWNKNVSISAALIFMCSGFVTSHLQHLNWISGAAFLPWCYWSYKNLFINKSFKAISIAVIFFYFFISSSHPGIIIGGIYFFSLLSIHKIYTQKKKNIKADIKTLIIFSIFLVLISSSIAYSYAEILPFITRGNMHFTEINNENTTTFNNWISFIFPFTTVNNNGIFKNELTLRNCYIGIIPLVFFFATFFYRIKENIIYIIIGFFFLFLSSGNAFINIFYKYLPLLSFVRLKGEYRLFTIFCFVIVSCNTYLYFTNDKERNTTYLKLLTKSFLFATGFISLISFIIILVTRKSELLNNTFLSAAPTLSSLKKLLTGFSFFDLLLLQSLVTTIILFLFYKTYKAKNYKAFLILIALDLIINVFLQLPFTGVGIKSTNILQSYLKHSPKGIPKPNLEAIELHSKGDKNIDKILGDWSLYNKEVGNTSPATYPIIFKTEEIIYNKNFIEDISKYGFIYFESDTTKKMNLTYYKNDSDIRINIYTPNEIVLTTNKPTNGSINLLYKKYKNWRVFVNNKELDFDKTKSPFYKIHINEGQNVIRIWFDVYKVKVLAIFSLSLFIVLLIIAIKDKLVINLLYRLK